MLTQEEIKDGVRRLAPWFHKIDLGHGLTTKTQAQVGEHDDHPLPTWRKIRTCWPVTLMGQSVLDVGCNAGFYAIEAKRRGATRVVGVDAQRHHITQANFVRRALGLDIEFRQMSVYDLSPRTVGQFDLTLALGLLYHCKHLVQAVEKLAHVTKQTLIIETAIFPPERQTPPFQHRIAGDGCDVHTFGYVENPPNAREAVYNWFLPSVAGLQALLQNVGFEQIRVADVADSRAIVVARKQSGYADTRTPGPIEAALSLLSVEKNADTITLNVRAENTGFVKWIAGAVDGTPGIVSLGAHLLNAAGEVLQWEYGTRATLPHDILPGATAEFILTLSLPKPSGYHVIELDLVADAVAWFEDLGNVPLRYELSR